DDPRVVAGVRRRGHGGDERVEVRGPADAGQFAAPGQLVGDGDGVGGLTARVEVEDRLVHQLVRWAVVIRRPDDLDDVGDGVLRQQHAAQDALLSGDVVGRHPLEFFATALRQLSNTHRTPSSPCVTLRPAFPPFYQTGLTSEGFSFWRPLVRLPTRPCG